MLQNTRYGVQNFHLFCFSLFRNVSKRFETIESVDLEILSLFQYVSVVLLYNLYVLMFRNTRYGVWNFHLFMFQFVSKCFETTESVDLEIFSAFIMFMFQCFETNLKHLVIYFISSPEPKAQR